MSRVRLSLLAPFEPAKILFPMPADISRISHLKRHLVRSLSSIASVTTSAKELRLEIDGFELLSGAAIDVIREDDVVWFVPKHWRGIARLPDQCDSHSWVFFPDSESGRLRSEGQEAQSSCR